MSGAVTDNCFHQGDRPQQDLANHLSRLDAYRLHAVDAEQDQTSDTAAQNVVIHSQTSYIFLTGPQCAEPEARCYGGAFRSLQAYYTPVLK